MSDDIAKLRADYKAATGKNAFNGWDAAELTKRIADAANPPPEPSQSDANEIKEDATGDNHPRKGKKPDQTVGDPFPTQADLDAMRAGTFQSYKTR